MMGIVSLVINVSIAALLVAVIVYCVRLNRNIRVLQDSKGEMAKLFAEFDASIARAAQSVAELQHSAKQSDQILKEKLDKANMIADDLAFMIERGNKMADQLESGLKGGRPSGQKETTAPKGMFPEPETTETKPMPDNNKLGPFAPKTTTAKPPLSGERPQASARTASSIESVLEQIANRNNPASADSEKRSNTRIRSRAEQELLDSLKSGR